MALTTVFGESGNEIVDAFINNGRHYVNAPGVEGPFVINYYFGKLTGTTIDGNNYGYDWRPYEKQMWSTAVKGWEAVANVKFVQVFTQAEALFVERLENQLTAGGTVSASHSLPSTSTTAQSQGTYNFEAVNVRQWSPDQIEPGGNFFRTFIHETGHGLGLKHPHDSGSGTFAGNYFPGIVASQTSAERQRSLGTNELNHMFGSVMSYLHGYEFDDNGKIDLVPTRQRPVADDFFLDHGFAATPMAYDIAAIQYLYGANTTTNSGNNIYVLPDTNSPHPFVRGEPNEVGVPESIIYQPDVAFWSCIWDTGGIDEIVYNGLANAFLDLRAATLDFNKETSWGGMNYAAFIGGGYTIAAGAIIENATGGEGNDHIQGNEVANVLTGNGGNDTLIGGMGADTLIGGAGADVFLGTAEELNGDTITDFSIEDTISVLGTVTSAVLSQSVLSFVVGGTTFTMNLSGWDGPDVPLTISSTETGSLIRFSSNPDVFGSPTTDVASQAGKIYSLIDGILGRTASALEIETGVAALHTKSLTALAADYLASAEGDSLYGDTDNATFVSQLYHTALGRDGDVDGLAAWTAMLDGGASRAEIAVAFSLSGENLAGLAPGLADGIFVPDAETASAARLYYGLLERAPDIGGLLWANDYLDTGHSLSSLASIILGSSEYTSKHGAPSNAEFVTELYHDALGRDADFTGAVAWTSMLETGASRADVVIGFTESAEGQAYLASHIENNYFVYA